MSFARSIRSARSMGRMLQTTRSVVPGFRTVTTAAATTSGDAAAVPEDGDKPFTVRVHDDAYEAYKMDVPSLDLEVTKNELLKMYQDMVAVRRLELAADGLYKAKKIRGFCHLSVGQEAVAVGMENAIEPEDKIITSYRCHGLAYMRGVAVRAIIGELLGREVGVSKGKGGSMHMFGPNFYGGNGIVGAQVPLGAGLAFAQKYMNKPNVTFAMYGDGAANQGQVFEAFNMAKLWGIPAIFTCENNKYGMGTSAERSSAMTEYYKRGQYIPGLRVNGMDVLAVKRACKYLKDFALKNQTPLVVEFVTYRYGGHSMSDPGTTYRTREEIQKVRATKDPIEGLKRQIMEWGVANANELKSLEKKVRAFVDDEVAAAEASPFPEATRANLFADIYAKGTEPKYFRARTELE
ncbi:pyruvate dehydrogenase e1 component alpha subunit Pda1 [Schizosaccharomyces japonicus yFS275]|uniref:Pyruvate dehydrogenase E1 component subunit alpha n=1 Tax=Schizosaccharomyces japonicus (strain yFS275 / FY16936) TaxID=402676 RepID=B6JZG7_SCHJY|nr:pyruvate dehydrogenase e1 component alpha subunit Pda1 [Schizosaccharomyces japonicus yFS275]EEB06935.1 pyruvate dehydrogenase e1 component alpha subunit Pda1 [Schizosaccharomyces japonicus yFS275]